MKIVFYALIGLFALLGIGTLNAAAQVKFKHVGLLLGGLSYLGTSIVAYGLDSWWPLPIGFGLAWLAGFLFGDPGDVRKGQDR